MSFTPIYVLYVIYVMCVSCVIEVTYNIYVIDVIYIIYTIYNSHAMYKPLQTLCEIMERYAGACFSKKVMSLDLRHEFDHSGYCQSRFA